ncbi:MAG: DUF2997 domain-containing protein [bacterium]|nr:DUF2997 domain-containing protein [bacterium]
MAKSVVIEFNENGDCSIEGEGSGGPECDKALREIETALGQTTSRTKKPECEAATDWGSKSFQGDKLKAAVTAAQAAH